jgi:hypothetical protein
LTLPRTNTLRAFCKKTNHLAGCIDLEASNTQQQCPGDDQKSLYQLASTKKSHNRKTFLTLSKIVVEPFSAMNQIKSILQIELDRGEVTTRDHIKDMVWMQDSVFAAISPHGILRMNTEEHWWTLMQFSFVAPVYCCFILKTNGTHLLVHHGKRTCLFD